MNARFAFLKLETPEIEKLTLFYCDVLGLAQSRTIETDHIKEVVLRDSEDDRGFCIVLLTHKSGRTLERGNAYGALAFYVRDVAQAFDRAISKGAAPLQAPCQTADFHVAFVADPEGREIEFLSLKKAP